MGGRARACARERVIPPPIRIRSARAADLDAVLQIERASFGDPWSRASFESSLGLERIRFLVAEEELAYARQSEGAQPEPRVMGYAIALLLLDEAEIANVAVDSEWRGYGVGGRLLDQVSHEAAASGVKALYLEVRESNAAARALYASRSFAQVGQRRRYYRHPVEDALVLRRDIGCT